MSISDNNPIKVISFDLDDTLWPCFPPIYRAEEKLYQWLSEHVPQITDKYDIDQLSCKRKSIYQQYPELEHNLTAMRLKSFEVLANELSLPEDWFYEAFDVFYQARQQVTLYDDVTPVLDELTKSYQLVSLTNGNASTVATGVGHWFDFSLSSEVFGKMKSEPDIYNQMLKLTHCEANQMLHIGDHPIHDISGAKSAGVFAVWLNRENNDWELEHCEPDAVITSLHEIPSLLEKMP